MVKKDYLWQNGPYYYYDAALFPPTTDSFALGYFARPGREAAVCDLGSGTGLLGALLLARRPGLRVVNVERSGEALALARQAFEENGWAAEFREGDLRDTTILPPAGSMDYAVSNPPYFPAGGGKSAAVCRDAREESCCTLAEVCAAAKRVLRWGGSFALVHRPERLVDLLCALREHALEPKRLRFVTNAAEAAPALVLVEARRGGRPSLAVEPPLIIGSAEWDAVYFRSSSQSVSSS